MPADRVADDCPDAGRRSTIAAVDGAQQTDGGPPQGREAIVGREARRWREHLLDVGPRNNLLYWRTLTRGTLDLAAADEEVFQAILAGQRKRLSKLLDLTSGDALIRARVIYRRAREHLEERGLSTLHLAVGMASWTNTTGAAVPSAPIMLRPLKLSPTTPALDDFELVPDGEMALNEALLQLMARQFGVEADRGELASLLDGEIDTPDEVRAVQQWLARQCSDVPGFAVRDARVLGTFAYAKLPMVLDLEDVDQLATHDLVAALAGAVDARQAIRERQTVHEISEDQPDRLPPSDEFLVLDADASQSFAVNAVTAASDLVIKGPPGTGKSQTITNLIASLVARGQSVLFVAEKRAAIEAVTTRLGRVGLGDIVFDLHSQSASRRQIAQGLQASLNAVRTTTKPDRSEADGLLTAVRSQLNHQARVLHEVREPWGLSAYSAQAEALRLRKAADLEVRFRGEELQRLDSSTARRAEEELARLVAIGGPLLAERSLWATSNIDTGEQAGTALALVDRLLNLHFPAARQAMDQVTESCGFPQPSTLGEWTSQLALLGDVARTAEILSDEAFKAPLRALLDRLGPMRAGGVGRAVAGVFSGEFRAARRQLRGLAKQEQPDDGDLFRAASAAADQVDRWTSLSPTGAPTVFEGLETAKRAHEALGADLTDLAALLGRRLLDEDLVETDALLRRLQADRQTLFALPEIRELTRSLSAAGLGEAVSLVGRDGMTPEAARDALRRAWVESVLEQLQLTDRSLGGFSAEHLTAEVARFQAADRDHVACGAERVLRSYAESATAARVRYPDQATLIAQQAGRKRGHLPLRQLFREAPEMLLALKPCWAMSPLLVSQILPSDRPYFDVVIFDEASQVTPADAVPSVMRGKRLVVAGDERQLPPTQFFAAQLQEEDAEEVALSGTEGFESVLDAFTTFMPQRMLTWHYRSEDERLIAFSNTHIYGRSLTTFPGVGGEAPIRHRLAEESGNGADPTSSPGEVQAVVEEILRHAEERPHESLGVIALSLRHADRIEETLRQALANRRDLDSFFAESATEPFFVKNLERVQGDERDAIILTLGFSKGPDGRLRHNFGPINLDGGERRLNVAVTRAKRRILLVSAFSSVDVDPSRTSSTGATLLRQYLGFCESNGLSLGTEVTPAALNAFELDVRDALQARGVRLLPQYGCSGYRIDFAVLHPQRPGQMVLAIECDGATYHSAATARDRDRLRQEVLERLGWRFHRIWSTDWFRNREAAVDRALQAIELAVRTADAPATAQARADRHPITADDPPRPAPVRQGGCPVATGRGSIDAYTPWELRSVVAWVASDTLLRTPEELVAEVMQVLGFKRRGARIVNAIEAAVRAHQRRSDSRS